MITPKSQPPSIDDFSEYKPQYYWKFFYEYRSQIAFGISFNWEYKDSHIALGCFIFGFERLERER